MTMDLSTDIGIRLRNPTMLASGILGISYDILERVYNAGAGAVISKSISKDPREGYENPTIVKVDQGFINAVGLSNPGADYFAQEVKDSNIPLIINLVGSNEDEFVYMLKKFDELNIIGYEINFSCPHVEKVGLEVGDDPELVYNIIKRMKSITSKPIIAKLGLGSSNILEIAKVARDAGADAITAINTIRAMHINIEICKPVLSNKIGGLSGLPIKPIAVRCVYELSNTVDIPIIGCGGISRWEDAIEFILAGASAIQIGSAISISWLNIFNEINKGIKSYLERKGFNSIKELIGIARY
ncbi:MAG: dihydroorotate dehydrogenase [Candidatus Nitrosothermus koennekii]|nr:MAG: dihydroorotate dehydrogenase [Candidatus Nitrosothermus koennekii]